MIWEDGLLKVTCEFCNETYKFAPEVVENRTAAMDSRES